MPIGGIPSVQKRGTCSRCGRVHSGLCGIPRQSTVSLRDVQEARSNSTFDLNYQRGKSAHRPKVTRSGLDELLTWGVEQEAKLVELLRTLSSGQEYDDLIAKLDRVQQTNQQIRVQLVNRREK